MYAIHEHVPLPPRSDTSALIFDREGAAASGVGIALRAGSHQQTHVIAFHSPDDGPERSVHGSRFEEHARRPLLWQAVHRETGCSAGSYAKTCAPTESYLASQILRGMKPRQ